MDSNELTDKEQIREINKLAIITGIQQILANPDIKKGTDVSTTILGSNGEMKLEYFRNSVELNNLEMFSISIILRDPKTGKRIAQRDCEYRIPNLENPSEIYIEGMIDVREAQDQSQGYGSGLLLCTNIVIEDAMRRYPEFRGKLVTGHIADGSLGREENGQETVSRKGWASYFAKQLGYTETKKGIWEKVYQYASKDK